MSRPVAAFSFSLTYKPVYYSLALDKGYGYGSLLNDIPRAEVDPITGEVWVPQNLNNTVEHQVNLEYALVWSKNVPSVQLFKLVGGKEVSSTTTKGGQWSCPLSRIPAIISRECVP